MFACVFPLPSDVSVCVCAVIWPAVRDDAGQGLVQLILSHVLPVQHDAHAFGLDAGHAVVVVTEEGHAYHWHAVIHGLIDAIEAPVAQEGSDVGVACGAAWKRPCYLLIIHFLSIGM